MSTTDRTTRDDSIAEATPSTLAQTTASGPDGGNPRPCVHELVAARARVSPQALALASRDCRMSYAELDRRANRLANRLRTAGVGPEVVVGLCLRRSASLAVAALAILKAGGAYLSLDSSHPDERLAFMLSDARAPVLVTQASFAERLGKMAGRTVLVDDPTLDDEPAEASASGVAPGNLAYVIHTSGSTGTPKGVMVEHRNLLNLVEWHDGAFEVRASDRASQVASPSLDAVHWELWPYLVAGASVHFAPDPIRGDAASLVEWLLDEHITIAFLTTPIAESALDLDWPPSPALRILLTGGDILYRRPRPGLPFVLVNNYGPAEATVVTTSGPVSPVGGDGRPSIGKAISNFRLHVVDDELRPVSAGSAGELLIGGKGVARGYIHRPDLTREKFLPDPFTDEPGARVYRSGDLVVQRPDGEIEFRGRIDDQINLRGLRFLPIEITTRLDTHPGVRTSIVVVRDRRPGDRRLVAYVVPRSDRRPEAEELRAHVAAHLPYYMVPSHFVYLDELPLTRNGKVDRRALPLPEEFTVLTGSDWSQAQGTELEPQLAAIVTELLGIGHVGLDDNFFVLGGHSLLAAQLVTIIRDRFGVEMPLIKVFQAGTIAGLAEEVERRRATGGPRDDDEQALAVATRSSGTGPILFFLVVDESGLTAIRRYVGALDGDQPVISLLPPRSGKRYDRTAGVPGIAEALLAEIRKHQQHGPYMFCGHSLGGMLAYEMTGRLREQGEDVAWLGLLDTMAPDAFRAYLASGRRLSTRLRILRRRTAAVGLQAALRETGGRRLTRLRASAGMRLAPDEYDYPGADSVLAAYHTTGHDAALDLFATEEYCEACGSDTLGWAAVHRGPLHRHLSQRDHNGILHDPDLAMLDAFARRLREAKATWAGDAGIAPAHV
jgi:amino acid adenylation domain-containing protein